MEKAHGDEATFASVFQRALQGADPKQVHLHVAATHERAGDIELTDAAYEATCKRFKQVGIAVAEPCMELTHNSHLYHPNDVLHTLNNPEPSS